MVLSLLIALVLTLRTLLPYPQNIVSFLKILSSCFFSTITTILTVGYTVTDQNILYEPHSFGIVSCLPSLYLLTLSTLVLERQNCIVHNAKSFHLSPAVLTLERQSPSLWVCEYCRPHLTVPPHGLSVLPSQSHYPPTWVCTAVTVSQFHRLSLYEIGFSLLLLQPHNPIADFDP